MCKKNLRIFSNLLNQEFPSSSFIYKIIPMSVNVEHEIVKWN